jgi:hypothetical protein
VFAAGLANPVNGWRENLELSLEVDLPAFENAVSGWRENLDLSLEDDLPAFKNAVSGLRENVDGSLAGLNVLGATGGVAIWSEGTGIALRVFGMLIVASGSSAIDDVESLGNVINVLRPVLGVAMFGRAKVLRPVFGGPMFGKVKVVLAGTAGALGLGLCPTVTDGRTRVQDGLVADAIVCDCAGLCVGSAGRGRVECGGDDWLEITTDGFGRALGP